MFSPYRPDSDLRRLERRPWCGAVDPDLDNVLRLADLARRMTGGVFDVRATGRLDPSGIVKGWATQRAAAHLADLDVDYYLNAGGDLLVHNRAGDSPAWRIGIEHPADSSGLLAVVTLVGGAVATSGTSHRGAHLWDPTVGRPIDGSWQATVVGPELMWADVLATAAVVAGPERLDRTGWPPGYEVLLADRSGTVAASTGFADLLAPDVRSPLISGHI